MRHIGLSVPVVLGFVAAMLQGCTPMDDGSNTSGGGVSACGQGTVEHGNVCVLQDFVLSKGGESTAASTISLIGSSPGAESLSFDTSVYSAGDTQSIRIDFTAPPANPPPSNGNPSLGGTQSYVTVRIAFSQPQDLSDFAYSTASLQFDLRSPVSGTLAFYDVTGHTLNQFPMNINQLGYTANGSAFQSVELPFSVLTGVENVDMRDVVRAFELTLPAPVAGAQSFSVWIDNVRFHNSQ